MYLVKSNIQNIQRGHITQEQKHNLILENEQRTCKHFSKEDIQMANRLMKRCSASLIISSVQSLSHASLFATPWTAAHQAFLSITNSWSLPKLMSIESVMPSNCLILCHPLLLLPQSFPGGLVFPSFSEFFSTLKKKP